MRLCICWQQLLQNNATLLMRVKDARRRATLAQVVWRGAGLAQPADAAARAASCLHEQAHVLRPSRCFEALPPFTLV